VIVSIREGVLFLVLLVVTLIIALRIGRKIGDRARAAGVDVTKGMGTIENGVLGLLGLLLAFTFYNQEVRFERRIDVIVDEINAIATAYDQTSLFPEPARSELRAELREFFELHAHAFRTRETTEQRDPNRVPTSKLHEQLWANYLRACKSVDPQYCTNMLLPTINRMEETALAGLVVQHTHTPRVVMILLVVLSACGACVSGYSLAAQPGNRLRLHRLVYVIALGVTFYTIIDMEYPRWGLVTISDAVEPALRELQRRMAFA
jgi:hypothetical protein